MSVSVCLDCPTPEACTKAEKCSRGVAKLQAREDAKLIGHWQDALDALVAPGGET